MRKIIKNIIFLCLCLTLAFGFNIKAGAAEIENDTDSVYVLYVNRTQNCVTVMEQHADGTSSVARVMVCSCGRMGHATPEGIFSTSDYYEWRLMLDGTYGRYAVRFNKSILFHSVPYIEPKADTLEWDQYNLLGQNASLGCVRLAAADAKWIYDNCGVGTIVVVYSGDLLIGDVMKPAAIQIPEDSPYRNWDPTDLTAGNPWLTSEMMMSAQTDAAGSVDAFDYVDYADRYADVKALYGYNRNALYEHYIIYGIYEGRIAEFK